MGMLLSWTNWIDDPAASLAVDSEALGLGLRAVLTPQPSDVWRSGIWGATTINLDVDLGAQRSINLVALAAPRDGLLPGALATVSLEASAIAPAPASPEVLDTGAVALGLSPLGIWAWSSAGGIMARYLRLSFTGDAADAYLQLGRLWIGPALVTTREASLGHTNGVLDPGGSGRASITGVRDTQAGRAYRTLSWSHASLTTAEAGQVESAALACGATRQVFAARRAADLSTTGLFGPLVRPPAPVRASQLLWRADFSIEEDV